MLKKISNKFELYPHKITYTQNGETRTQWALPSIEWWQKFQQKWEGKVHAITDVYFEEVILNNEQLERFEKIEYEDIPESFISICIDYILDNKFPKDLNHPLKFIQIQEHQMSQDKYLIEQDFRLCCLELGLGV